MLIDSQMMLLEQIMYLNEKVYLLGNATKDDKIANTVKDIIYEIDTDALKANPNLGGSYIQYAEWGATIEAIKNDPDLMELKIRESLHNKSGQKIATCFEDKSGHAINGTSCRWNRIIQNKRIPTLFELWVRFF